jgi:hypothetical protein
MCFSRSSIENINGPRNALTLNIADHRAFDAFYFGLEHVGNQKYKLVDFALPSNQLTDFPIDSDGNRYIQFEYAADVDPNNKVSPGLLYVHLAIAHVFNATGRGEIDWFDEDDEKVSIKSSYILVGGSMFGSNGKKTRLLSELQIAPPGTWEVSLQQCL